MIRSLSTCVNDASSFEIDNDGAIVVRKENRESISNCRTQTDTVKSLFVGNSGTASRFLLSACALPLNAWEAHEVGSRDRASQRHSILFDGIERLRQRPVAALCEAIARLGGKITYPSGEIVSNHVSWC